jgi:hypothetical protein
MMTLLPYLLILAIFGPYVFSSIGVRTEQIIVYPLCALVIVLRRRNPGLPRSLRRVSLVWIAMLVLGVGVSLWFARPFTKILAGADDYLLPIAAIVVLSACLPDRRRVRHDSDIGLRVCTAIQWCLALNAGIEVLEALWPPVSMYLGWFWTGSMGSGELAVGRYALDAQRLIGIFNQPMEQGVAYGVGLFCWLYRASLKPPATRHYALLAVLLFGGVIGTSKVFLLGALPMFVVCYGPSVGHSQHRSSRVMAATLAIGLGCIATWYYADSLTQLWPGSARVIEMFQGDNLIAGITAGRLSSREEGALRPLISKVYEASPVFGIGFGGLDMVDSAYVSVYMAAGAVGLVLYLTGLGILLKSGVKTRAGRGAKWLWVATAVFIAGAGVGAPVLTLNRASTLMWCWLWVLASQPACEARVRLLRRCVWRQRPAVAYAALRAY